MDIGLLQVYTGDGKGKTTSAAGLALRARSRGLRVLFAQFMKETPGGEPESLRELKVEVVRFRDVRSPLFNKEMTPERLREAALKAIGKLREMMPGYDLVILDEFSHLLRPGILEDAVAREFIISRPQGTELVITGRGAPKWLIELADLVTEMKDVKHPIRKGLKARKGIEY